MNKLLLINFCIISFLFGCVADSDKGEISKGMGRVNFNLTDAPYPYDSIKETRVELEAIKLRSSSGQWSNTLQISQSFNLLDLQNGITAALGAIEVQPGEYNHIRMIISSASVTLSDDRVFNLKIPSGAQSGLKIFLDPPLEVFDGVETTTLLDFDVSRSFVVLGDAKNVSGIKGFNFKPVIRVGVSQDKTSLSGSVHGDYCAEGEKPLENATVTLYQDHVAIATNSTGQDGGYSFYSLIPGSYVVKVEHDKMAAQELEVTKVQDENLILPDVLLTGCLSDGDSSTAGKLTGKVISDEYTPSDLSDDTALANANVELLTTDGVSINSINTDLNGAYDFSTISGGSYKLRITHEFFQTEEFEISIGGDLHNETTLQMIVDPANF